MILDNEFETVKLGAFHILRRIGSTVILFKSLVRSNTTDHYKATYKTYSEEETE